jgi:hypothetical protein
MLLKLIKEPMLQFFLTGALLYLAFQVFNPGIAGEQGNKPIVVDNSVLKNLLNIRNQKLVDEFDVNVAFDSLEAIEKESLAADYIEQEAFYRMALEMGLDQNDFVIRRRMMQKLSFLIEDLNTSQIEFADDTLKAYYDEHAEEFGTASKLSFTHVYLAENDSSDSAFSRASELLSRFNSKRMSLDKALSHGDRFPLQASYENLTATQTSALFGTDFSRTLFSLTGENSWHGPLQSGYGYHVVYIKNRELGHIPAFASMRDEIATAYQYSEKLRLNRLARLGIVENYEVLSLYD